MKNLSIRQYLFILIGAILLGIAAIQLVLISVFKQHLNQEVAQKSKLLSTRIIDLAVEQIDLDGSAELHRKRSEHENRQPNIQFKHLNPISLSKAPKIIKVEKQGNCTVTRHFESNDQKQAVSVQLKCDENELQSEIEETLTLKPPHINQSNSGTNDSQQKPHVRSHVYKTIITDEQQQQLNGDQRVELRQQLHRIIEKTHNDQQFNTFAFINGSPNQFETVQSSTSTGNNAVDTLTNYMIYLVIASSIVALIIAMWLSHHFTHPLRTLANGFEQLEKGDFGIQIPNHGIGEYQKTLGSFNQMSQHLKTLAESEKSLQQQSHLAELGEVSRGLAHALRNPMHTIGLSVEQLKDPSLPDKTKAKMHTRIQAKIDHIDKTIKALLTLTAGEITRTDNVPLKAVLQDIILEMKANSAEVSIALHCDDNLTPTVQGSESEIRAILHTLVVNAVEANNNQGTVTIDISSEPNTDSNSEISAINIAVIDQGQGIAPSIKDKLFQPHVSSKAEGAGMGLYIAKRLATLYYGGNLTLDNHPNGGCIAQVTLSKTQQGDSHE